ncbi:hypothetical protein GEMRC1_009620 [Eukaryota sp. GEM-RC1]
MSLQGAMEISKNTKQDSIVCFECEEALATVFCSECDANYCGDCSSAAHKLKALRSHSVVPIHPTISISVCDSPPSLRINVGVWVWNESFLNDLSEKIKKGFAENWGDVDLSINSFTSKVQSFKELTRFDVLVVDGLSCLCPGQFLDQFLNQDKGLVLFNSRPSSIKGGFSNSCFNGGGDGSYLTGQTQHVMVKTLPNDPIFLNVNSFSINFGFRTQKSVNGTLLATVNSGIPLIAKKEVGGGRLVEFGCPCFSSDSNSQGPCWSSSTDGHRLFANSIIWVNQMVK